MTGDEAKEAMRKRLPIIYKMILLGEIEYERIVAIDYRIVNKRMSVVLELKDKRANSITLAPMRYCRVKE